MRKQVATALITLALTVPLAACSGSSDASAQSCATYKVAVLDDASHHAGLWAIEQGKVSSDRIDDVEVTYLQIPALIQATGTDQYDSVEAPMVAIPQINARGGDLQIQAFAVGHTGDGTHTWVKADSDINSPADLKGKTVGIQALGSTLYYGTQHVYQEKYGLDAAQENGDIKWTELDPPTMMGALKAGHIDAAVLSFEGDWRAAQDQGLRPIDELELSYHELTGSNATNAVFSVASAKVENSEDCVREFQRMLLESSAYAKDNIAEVAPVIAEEQGVSQEYIEFWWTSGNFEFVGMDEEWISRGQSVVDVAASLGVIPDAIVVESISVTR